MSNYALDTPVLGKVWVPDIDIPFGRIEYAPNESSEISQSHRSFNWLHDNPQKHTIFPTPIQQNSRDLK
jgi:hypothetical protein